MLSKQIAYYRARAAEYDDWFYRRGRYDRGLELNTQWYCEVETLKNEVGSLGNCERILEMACGTGIWTYELAKISETVDALDASPEMLDLACQRVPAPHVRYHLADLFDYEPEREYDLVFMAFWLSHVPPGCLDGFLKVVRGCLRPGGRLFIIDSLFDQTSSARNHQLADASQSVQTRKLRDGREFQVVKVFYDPNALKEQLEKLQFECKVNETGRYFFAINAGLV